MVRQWNRFLQNSSCLLWNQKSSFTARNAAQLAFRERLMMSSLISCAPITERLIRLFTNFLVATSRFGYNWSHDYKMIYSKKYTRGDGYRSQIDLWDWREKSLGKRTALTSFLYSFWNIWYLVICLQQLKSHEKRATYRCDSIMRRPLIRNYKLYTFDSLGSYQRILKG